MINLISFEWNANRLINDVTQNAKKISQYILPDADVNFKFPASEQKILTNQIYKNCLQIINHIHVR